MQNVIKPPLGRLLNRGHRLAPGLVGCWLFNEGRGNLVNDLSGHGLTMSQGVGGAWGAGTHGPSLYFDGSDDYWTFSNPGEIIQGSNQISCALWMKITAQKATGSYFIFGHISSDRWLVYLQVSGGGTINQITWEARDAIKSNQSFAVNQWIHIVGTYDGVTQRIYVNGRLDNTYSSSNRPPLAGGTILYVGGDPVGSLGYAPVMVSSAMVWPKRTLTAADVSQLYCDPFAIFRWEPIWLFAGGTTTTTTTSSTSTTTTTTSTTSTTTTTSSTASTTSSTSSTASTTSSTSSTASTTSSTTSSSTTTTTALAPQTVCWGHQTAVEEDAAESLYTWGGTGTIAGAGDDEVIQLFAGQEEISPTWYLGAGDNARITLNKYQAGDALSVQYKTGASVAACEADIWHDYVGAFTSGGYVKVRVYV